MKNVIITFLSLLLSYGAASAGNVGEASQRTFGYSNAMIFIENGITFSVYPDGEFDFFIDQPAYVGAAYQSPGVNISFNAGFNYDPWVQYDDYGAVIQIENTPLYYDFYGRISRIGAINIYYNGARVSRIGGLYVYYDPYGAFNRFSGYVNVYNRHYVYRPVYNYFVRPAASFCIVNTRPYRRYYHPVRYTYYKPYKNNYRRAYASVGRTYHHKEVNPRRKVYLNDRRVATRNDMRVKTDIRNRSLKYETNNRGYRKSSPSVYDRKETATRNARSYNKDQRTQRTTPVRQKDRNYRTERKQPVRVSTTRTTEVQRPGKTITRSTTVTSTGRKGNKTSQKVESGRKSNYSKKSDRGANKGYSGRSSAGKQKAERSSNGRGHRS